MGNRPFRLTRDMGSDQVSGAGARIRQSRQRAGLSLARLAALTGLSKSYLVRLETDPTSNPSLEVLRRIADALDITVADLVGAPRIEFAIEDIGPMLEAFGCYRRRDEAIRRVVPQFQDGWRCKVVLAGSPLDSERLNVPYLAVEFPDSVVRRIRLPATRSGSG